MEILRSFRSFQFRKRLQGISCKCGLSVPWSLLRRYNGTSKNIHALHDVCIDHISFTETALNCVQTPTQFRQLLLKEIDHFRIRHQVVCRYAVDRGEEFAHVLFSLQRFTTVLRIPSTMNNYYAYQYYYSFLQRGWVSCANLIRTWPSFHAGVLTLGYLRDFLGPQCLASPAFRDEIRQSRYTNMLRVYGAECRLANSGPKYIQRTFKEGVASSLRNYYQSLLVFWCVHVRTKLRHWRLAHSFKPMPRFVPNTDALDVLVHRNPHRVPNTTAEFLRAIQEKTELDDGILVVPTLQQWLINCPDALLPFAKLCVRNNVLNWYYVIVKLAQILPRIVNEELLLRYLNFLHKAPIYDHVYETGGISHGLLHNTLGLFLNNPQLPFTDASVLSCIKLHRKICWTPALFRRFVEYHHVRNRLCKPVIADTIVKFYANRDMCLRLSTTYTKDDISMNLWQSSAMQTMYAEIVKTATCARLRFLTLACRKWKQRQALRKVALTTYRHCWLTVVARWRWVRDYRMCPVCMETGHTLIALHGEIRHAICRECLWRVRGSGNRCPMCRQQLELCTVSCASSVSYTSDYEDPNYDDDQWYHYD
jgi:hypothetical protein